MRRKNPTSHNAFSKEDVRMKGRVIQKSCGGSKHKREDGTAGLCFFVLAAGA